MRHCIFSAWGAQRCHATKESLERRVAKPVYRLACCYLSFGLLTLMVGCGKNPHEPEQAEVSGTVLFQGKPLPGGRVTFVLVKGGFESRGIIDENGNYTIKAPVGDVEIGVDNRWLAPRRGPTNKRPILKKPGAQEAQRMKGRWVNIPSSYADPHASGLKYTVKPGSQTHDIELSQPTSKRP